MGQIQPYAQHLSDFFYKVYKLLPLDDTNMKILLINMFTNTKQNESFLTVF